MGNAVESISEQVSDAASNAVGSVEDFIAAPAATISETWIEQRDQETAHQMGVVAPVASFVSGDLSLGETLEVATKSVVNSDLALITGKENNQENAGIVRNTVVGVVGVAAAAYGGILALSGGGLGTAGGAGAGLTVTGAAAAGGGTAGAAAAGGVTLAEVGTVLTGATAVATAGGELAQAVTPPSDPVPDPVAATAPQASKMEDYLPYIVLAGVAAKILLL